eukprot:SAG31_NODE_5329_length_2608_cov_1.073735_2_plen_95_part_00
MHIVAWHLPIAMSGQQADLHKGSLTFAPKVQPPFTLPVFMPGVLGTLSANGTSYTIKLTVGSLELATLAVDGHAAPNDSGKVKLVPGKQLTWSV